MKFSALPCLKLVKINIFTEVQVSKKCVEKRENSYSEKKYLVYRESDPTLSSLKS